MASLEALAIERRLSAILAADIAGYSRLMGEDEAATVRALKGHQAAILPLVGRHGGRVIDTAGDGLLAEFPSVIGATECAVEIQAVMAVRNEDVSEHRRMRFRIGINLGDVIHDETRIYGDGINVAARLEALAEAGGVLVSQAVHDQVRDRLGLEFDDLGECELKNIARPVRVYRVDVTGAPTSQRRPAKRWSRVLALAGGLIALAAIGAGIGWYWTRDTRDPVLALPRGASIAVLPLSNVSGDPNDAYFSDGLTEDIITALTRFSDLFVIARSSTSQFRGDSIDPTGCGSQTGSPLGIEGQRQARRGSPARQRSVDRCQGRQAPLVGNLRSEPVGGRRLCGAG